MRLYNKLSNVEKKKYINILKMQFKKLAETYALKKNRCYILRKFVILWSGKLASDDEQTMLGSVIKIKKQVVKATL